MVMIKPAADTSSHTPATVHPFLAPESTGFAHADCHLAWGCQIIVETLPC